MQTGMISGYYDANYARGVQNTPYPETQGIGHGIPIDEDEQVKAGYVSSPEECQTCKERKYQDGSDENVSFKSAQHISPEAAGARVKAHEAEHVSNAYVKAAQGGGQVVSASVSIHTDICPECGRVYVSGGVTQTAIKYPNEENPYQQAKKISDAEDLKGSKINYIG
ncbi:MAG: hypothetical protein IJ567_01730 [Lachnospiraceae bacterium]|nr:hypothetical protein [Lachnospiraceae bacterium]